MKIEELYSPVDWKLITQFKTLPSGKRKEIEKEAFRLVKDSCKHLPKLNGLISATKSRINLNGFYDIAVVTAIVIIMKRRSDGEKASSEKNRQKKEKTQ